MNITWDENKRETNLTTQGLDFNSFGAFDWTSAILRPTYVGSFGQRRFIVVGFLGEDLVTAVCSRLGPQPYR